MPLLDSRGLLYMSSNVDNMLKVGYNNSCLKTE